MQLGFLTACLPGWSLTEIADWAQAHGYQALEVAAWPAHGDRPFTATHIDVKQLTARQAEDVTTIFRDRGLTLSSLAYYDNNLHPDAAERAAVHAHLLACVEAAGRLGCPTVGTFVGRDPGQTVAANLRAAEALFKPIVDRAGELGVKIVIENCVMEGWHPDGYPGNLAYSAELWEWMFSIGLHLNYDPSHLVWMGIDPVAALKPYVDRIAHAQAKTSRSSPRHATGTAGQAWQWTARIHGMSAGGATASRDWDRSTGPPSWTRCMRAAWTPCCRSSTRTQSGAARRNACWPA
jgi:sugar phosphate isomerase/epimerase